MKPKPQEQKTFTPAPAGTHAARLIRILHIGTIITEYKGEKKKSDKIHLTFELPNEKQTFDPAKGEQPFLVSEKYTFSFGEKANLRPIVEGVLGRKLTKEEAEGEFDITTLINMPCALTIVHNHVGDKVYGNISAVTPLMKGIEAPEALNKTVVMDYEHWDEEYFQKLPKFIREMMETSDEYRQMKGLEIIKLPEVSDEESQNQAYEGIGEGGGEGIESVPFRG